MKSIYICRSSRWISAQVFCSQCPRQISRSRGSARNARSLGMYSAEAVAWARVRSLP